MTEQEQAVDRVARLEAEALLKLIELGGRQALVALVVVEDNGDSTLTVVPSSDTTALHVRAFAAAMQREADRLRALLPEARG